MVGKKTWTTAKKKSVLRVGKCFICSKQFYNTQGGWIINAEGKYFCETHEENKRSCFDQYIVSKKPKTAFDW